jgi:hypothetical protein
MILKSKRIHAADFQTFKRTVVFDWRVVDLMRVTYSVEIPTRCSFVIEFIIPKFTEGSIIPMW